MADDLNRLLIKIQADTSQLASALARAESGVAQSSAKIERTIEKNALKFKKWGDAISAEFTRVLAGYATFELARKSLETISQVADINDLSAAAAVSTNSFQELSFAAQSVGVSVEAIGKGMAKFAINVSQARLNAGSFNDFLKEQAPSLRAALLATKSQEEAISVFSDALSTLGDEGQRTTLIQQAFGKAGIELLDVFDKGSGTLREFADQARELGVVMDKELLDSAEETEKAYKALLQKTESIWQRMVVGAYVGAKGVVDAIKQGFSEHNFSAFGDNDPLGINSLLDRFFPKSGDSQDGRSLELHGPVTKGWDATVNKNKSKSWSLSSKPDNTGRDALANLQKQFDQSNGYIQQALQDQYDQELRSWREMLDKKQITEAQFAEARTQLGIMMLNQQKENLGAETQQQKEYYSQIQSLMNSTFMDSFSTALETGKFKASEFFNSLLQGFAKITMEVLVLKPLLNSLFTGANGSDGLGGMLNGFLKSAGSVFSPARAAGGPGNAGASYLVGEYGPEIFTPNANGAFGGSGIFARGNSNGGNVYNIDARGADVGVTDRLAKLFASQRQQSPVMAVRQAAKRFPTRG